MRRPRRLTFWEHLEEFRGRIFVVLCFVLVFTVLGYLAFPRLYDMISEIIEEELYATRITEGFIARLRAGLLIGVFMSLPVFLIELTLFIFPALGKREKTILVSLVSFTFLLFIGGLLFAYRQVLPVSMAFLKSRDFYPENVGRLISYQAYMNFFFQFLIGFGLCFQFPTVILLMVHLGLVTPAGLVRKFKYFIISAAVISAIITPPDVISQLMMLLPMIVLYVICIPASFLIAGRKKRCSESESVKSL